MKSKDCFRLLASFLLIATFSPAMPAQNSTTTSTAAPGAATAGQGPPKFLNMVHRQLKAGRSAAYEELETSLVHIYNRENIPAFWLELQSMTGAPEVLDFSLFDSPEEMSKAMDASSAGLAADPRLQQMRERLLEDNVSSESSVLGVRRDDMGYRANSIDFSKMRVLRLTTILAQPGFDRAFAQAEWSLSEASEKVNAKVAWAVYEVVAGLPQPSYVIVAPMQSLQGVNDAIETGEALQKANGGAVEEQLQGLARNAYGASNDQLFSLHPKASHVSKEFAAGDPNFWSPATPSAASPGAARKQSGASGPKP